MIRSAAKSRRGITLDATGTCKGCGQSFRFSVANATRGRAGPGSRIFCSAACYQDRPGLVARVCLTCSREFMAYTSEVKKGRGKYCDQRCYHRSEAVRASRQRQHERGTVACVCRGCGAAFTVERNRLSRGNPGYCTRACFLAHTQRVVVVCQFCGKSRRVFPSMRRPFCSVSCANASKRIKKDCATCRRPMTLQRSESRRRFCSPACAHRAQVAAPIACATCGKAVVKKPSHRKARTFCNAACYAVAKRHDVTRWIADAQRREPKTPPVAGPAGPGNVASTI